MPETEVVLFADVEGTCPLLEIDGLTLNPSIRMCALRASWVGVEPDGFTQAGGGGVALHRLEKWLEETFFEVIIG